LSSIIKTLIILIRLNSYEMDEFCFILDKFQVIHDKQQHSSGPGGSFGYGGGGGRRMARGGAYFPASFV
jgi:hypothetical protein